MATYGAKALSRVAVAKQTDFTTARTLDANTGEVLAIDAMGILDPGVTVELGDSLSMGKRTAIQAGAVTVTGRNPIVTLSENAVSLRNLPLYFVGVGGTVGVDVTDPYTWIWSPAQGDVDTLSYLSMLMSDGVQKYKAVGAVPTEITLSADASGILSAGATFAARSVATSTDTFPTAIPAQPMLSGRLLKLYTDTNFPVTGGSGETAYSYLLSFNLSITTGVQMINALDASLLAATAAETGALDATLTVTVASNSAAIANGAFGIDEQGEQRYLRIAGTDASGYGIEILGSWVIESVTPISSEQDGLVVNEATLRLAYDTTAGKSIEVYVTSPLASFASS